MFNENWFYDKDNCYGCYHELDWHTTIVERCPGHKPLLYDAHSCFGPPPVTPSGRLVAVQWFEMFKAKYSGQLSPELERQFMKVLQDAEDSQPISPSPMSEQP